MNEVRKLYRVLDKKNGHVVSDKIEVSLVGVKLNGETTNVSRQVGRSSRSRDSREPNEDGRFARGVLEKLRFGDLSHRFVNLKDTVGTGPSGMNDAFRDALVIKMRDLLTHDEVFEQRRPSVAGLQRILVVVDPDTVVGRQKLVRAVFAIYFQFGTLLTYICVLLFCWHFPSLIRNVPAHA